MAMILRSMASAPVGGPPGASGSGTATRAAYHRTAPRTSRRKTAVISAGKLSWSTTPRSGGWRDGIGRIGDRARNGLGRTGLYVDPARPVDLDREAIHRTRRRALNDLAVAVVDRPVARTLEASFVGECLIASIGRAGHRRVLRRPGNGATEVRTFPVQRE